MVNEGLLLAKCKLISKYYIHILIKFPIESNILKVEELLKECEFYLSELKMKIPELRKELTEHKKENRE